MYKQERQKVIEKYNEFVRKMLYETAMNAATDEEAGAYISVAEERLKIWSELYIKEEHYKER